MEEPSSRENVVLRGDQPRQNFSPRIALLAADLLSPGSSEVDPGIATFNSEEELRCALDQGAFDILVLDSSVISHAAAIDLLYWTKILDFEPVTILLMDKAQSELILDAYRAGAFRVIVKQHSWSDEYVQALEQATRFKQMEEENTVMHAKLTETNSLLEEQNRRLDEFSTAVAHDIRAPLGAIVMRLEFLQDELGVNLKGRSKDVLERTLEASQRVIDLVGGIYEFARMGRHSGKKTLIDTTQLITNLKEDLQFEGEGLVKLDLGDLPNVFGQRTQLQRVFLNLITNSVKYRSSNDVRISIYQRGMQQRLQRKFAIIAVEDNGPGIPVEYHKSVFTMFSRGKRDNDSSGKDSNGLGIGLTAVKRIVEQHYGEISIDPEYTNGLRVLISLPTEPVELFR